MRGLRLSLLVNLVGTGWSAIVGLIFVPIYLRLLGIEAYGLIGLYLTVQSLLQVLDLGVSPTINRELARRTHASAGGVTAPDEAAATRDLVRTFEWVCFGMAALLGIVCVTAAAFFATSWIRAEHLPSATVREAAMMMALLIGIQWPLGFYYGGLRGLDRPGIVNAVQIVTATASAGGAALVLWLYSPSITAFFTWQVFIASIRIVIVRLLLWRSLPASPRRARLDAAALRHVWRFAAGISAITLTGILLANLDKIVLSRLLPLSLLGYYLLASQVSGALTFAVAPVFNTVFPRFSALTAPGDRPLLASTYHQMTQVMAVLIMPIAGVLILCADELILLWTRDAATAAQAAPVLRWLVAGTALNGMMNLPYALQLAFGWTRLGLKINIGLLSGLIPALAVTTHFFGAVGAASAWFGLNAAYMAVGVWLTHRRLLPGETMRWFGRDFLWPAMVAFAIVVGVRTLLPAPVPRLWHIAYIALLLGTAMLGTACAAGDVRAVGMREIGRLRHADARRDS